MDVALASCVNLPEPDPDAAPLIRALAAEGIVSEVLAWDDPAADWSRARMTVLRSTWNYPLHRDEFLGWADRAHAVSRLWNPLRVVRWNTHKGYLVELGERGLPVTPTVLLRRGSRATLRSVLDDRGWDVAVVKPAVSAASLKTRRIERAKLESGEQHLRDLLHERDVLIQCYLPTVESYGERALVWIDGEVTHAVRKSPRFEGQDESVSAEAVAVSDAEVALAEAVLAAVEGPLLYARVDMAPGGDGKPVLMELELVEPSLFFPQCPRALERFVAGIRSRLDGNER